MVDSKKRIFPWEATDLAQFSSSNKMGLPPPGLHNFVLKIAEKLLKEKKIILDAAAGTGMISAKLYADGHSIYAMDIEPPNKIFPFEYTKYDMNKSPYPYNDGFFDLIFSIETLEHLYNPAIAIKEFSRLVKVGGNVILSTPNVQSFRSRLKYFLYGVPYAFKYKTQVGMDEHVTPIFLNYLLQLFKEMGFVMSDLKTFKYKYMPRTLSRVFSRILFYMDVNARYDLSIEQFTNIIHGDFVVIIARKQSRIKEIK